MSQAEHTADHPFAASRHAPPQHEPDEKECRECHGESEAEHDHHARLRREIFGGQIASTPDRRHGEEHEVDAAARDERVQIHVVHHDSQIHSVELHFT